MHDSMNVILCLCASAMSVVASAATEEPCDVLCPYTTSVTQGGHLPSGVTLTIGFLPGTETDGHAYQNTCATCPEDECKADAKLDFDNGGTTYRGRFRTTGGGWTNPLQHYHREGKLIAGCESSQFLEGRVDDSAVPFDSNTPGTFWQRATLTCGCSL